MNINDLKTSRFITKNDLPAAPHGVEVVIQSVSMENAAPSDQKPEMKPIVYFAEFNKPFVLNITNATTIASLLGSEETDDWKDGKIELYYDPNIMMGPKKVGGIRIRPTRDHVQVNAAQPNNNFDNDVPL
jgi:hypothetical protein